MLKFLLIREIKTDKQTHGRLFKINDKNEREFICYTLEDAIRDKKIKNETAIKAGTYTVIVTMSPRFKKELPLLLNVPEFSGVRIHGGNTEKNTEGCVLVGMVRHMNAISNCASAVALITKMIKEAKQAELKIV